MKLIPVLDLMGGRVVRAAGGERKSYQTLKTPLSASTTLDGVGGALLARFSSADIYIADLDAITAAGSHADAVTEFCNDHRDVRVLLDDGRKDLRTSDFDTAPPNLDLVIGSETLVSVTTLQNLPPTRTEQILLSLDFRNGQFLGPADVLNEPDQWPPRVIVMTLDHVGQAEGPDFDTLAQIISTAGDRDVFAAGGVRSLADMEELACIGAAGALVATALHQGQIKTGDLEKIAGL